MESISEKNGKNVFEEYLEAYLREHPEAAEPLFRGVEEIRGTLYRDDYKGLRIQYNYGVEYDRLSAAYFKVYDHDNVLLAERVAELHFKDSGRECHIDPYGKKPWILNENDVKKIQNFLREYNSEYSIEYDGGYHTHWEVLCYQWNVDNDLFPKPTSLTDYEHEIYEIIRKDDNQLNSAYVPGGQKIPDTWNYVPPKVCADFQECRPVFREGDIVSITEDNAYPNSLYVVREAVLIDIGVATEYVYEVSPLESEEEVYTYGISSLELLYHDSVWEKYFTDSVRNGLPEWRGEPYNADVFLISDYYSYYYEKEELAKEHNNDTIPPDYMWHILEWHSVIGRIGKIFDSPEDVKEMEEKLNVSQKDLHDLMRSITDKKLSCNREELKPNLKTDTGTGFRFTDLELSLASQIDRRDIVNGEYNGHFPIQMTSLQIMKTIKKAYHAAHKISPRKLQRVCDKRDASWCGAVEVISPVKGSALYEGRADGLRIRFWYNFDLNLIEDAYPVIKNNSNGKIQFT